MKKFSIKNFIKPGVAAVACAFAVASCNKELPGPTPITFPSQGTQSAVEFITSDTTYSYFLAAITKAAPAVAGTPTLLSMLSDKTAVYTIFAPNNAAFRASGIPSVAAINSPAFTAAQLDALFRYHIIPGEQWPLTNIPTTFPNVQLPSLLTLGSIPGTAIPFRMSLYPSKRANGTWVNTTPVIATDKILINGVLHTVASLVPPSSASVLKDTLSAPTSNFSLFWAAVMEADSGQTDPTKTIQYALTVPFANLTVFAPSDTSVKTLISALTGGLIPLAAPKAVFVNFIQNNLNQRGSGAIVAYHILPTKAFSVNFPTTPGTFIKPTLLNLNPAAASHPGVIVQSFFTGPFVDSIKVTGVGNGGVAATSKPRTNFDRNYLNGVLHAIDRVLLPQ